MGEALNSEVVIAMGITLAGLLLAIIVWNVIITAKLRKMRKAHDQMMGDSGVENLEQVISELQRANAEQQVKLQVHGEDLKGIRERLTNQRGWVGIHRYNAFAEQGNDLSFSLAIINEKLDGVVISGIHSREETYVYAKPLQRGESSYALSPEERKAINLALPQA